MATDKTEFELWLKSRWDGDALKAAEAQFKHTQKAAKDTATSMDDLGSSAKNLKAMLVEVFAIAELVSQFKEGFEQVAKLEQVFNQLERAAKQNGEAFEDVKGKVTAFADSLKRIAGIDDDAAIAAVTKLYTATGDLDESLRLVRLAADVSVAALIPFEQANQLVLQVAQGNTRALRELGLSIATTGDKSRDADAALGRLSSTFGGASQNAKGLTVDVNRLSERWEDFRNGLVERVTPAIGWGMKAIESFLAALDGATRMASEGMTRVLSGFNAFGRAAALMFKGDIDGALDVARFGNAEMTSIADELAKISEETQKKISAIWAGAKGAVVGGGGTPGGIGTGGAGAAGGSKADGYDPRVAEENFRQEELRKLREKMYTEAEKAERDYQRNVLKMRAHGQKETVRIEKELDDEREQLMRAQTQRILAEVQIRKQAEEAKREAALASADAVVGAMGAIFGESKAVASAEAAINTYAGAARALKDWPAPYSYIIAAAVIAAGLARVAQINSTEPGNDATRGSGFDDPRNDQAAYIGGRRWAADMISEFTKGVSSGWAAGMGAGGGSSTTTYDNRRTFNVHLHGAGLIDPNNVQMVKQLRRTLDVVDAQIEGQRATARRS